MTGFGVGRMRCLNMNDMPNINPCSDTLQVEWNDYLRAWICPMCNIGAKNEDYTCSCGQKLRKAIDI